MRPPTRCGHRPWPPVRPGGYRMCVAGSPPASRSREPPTENFACLISHCLLGAVVDHELLPVGVLPTHRAVRLTLRLAALKELRTLRKPRTILHPERDKDATYPSYPAGTLGPWINPRAELEGAQHAWDAWTKEAKEWLLRRAGITQEGEAPYKGRGAQPVARLRMPLPIATYRRHGEVHGKAKIWASQANRYRELARARAEHRQHYRNLLVAAIAANPPGGRDPMWVQRDQKIASWRATQEDITSWAAGAKQVGGGNSEGDRSQEEGME